MSSQQTVGGVLAGRYELQRELGRGAMGVVWQALDTVLGRQVAVKEVQLPADLSEADRAIACERTLREARAIARMAHPNVVTLYDVLDQDERPWVVMELVPAPSLADELKKVVRLHPKQVINIGISVLSALEAAHRAGITHRDVKPANILLGEDGRIRLADFGIAQSVGDSRLTGTGMLVGSPAYMAPEVIRGQPVRPAADIFGLGATLYTAVEGTPPFAGKDAMATLASVASNRRPHYRHAGELVPLLDGLLEKDPQRRLGAAQARGLLVELDVAIPDVDRAEPHRSMPLPANGSARSESFAAQAQPADRKNHRPPEKPIPAQQNNDLAPTMVINANSARPPWQGSRQRAPEKPRNQAPKSLFEATTSVVQNPTQSPPPLPPSAQFRPNSPWQNPPPAATSKPPRFADKKRAIRTAIGVVACLLLLVVGYVAIQSVTADKSTSDSKMADQISDGPIDVPAGFTQQSLGNLSSGIPQNWKRDPQRRGVVDYNDTTGDRFLRLMALGTSRSAEASLASEEKGFADTHKDYERLKLAKVKYRSLDAADWEFSYDRSGSQRHVLYRSFIVDGKYYGIYLSTAEADFAASKKFFNTAVATAKVS